MKEQMKTNSPTPTFIKSFAGGPGGSFFKSAPPGRRRHSFKGGFALVKKSFYSYMSSRGFFWTLVLAWMMGPLVYLFVWMTAAGGGSVGGFSRGDFAVYYVALIFVNQLTYPTSNWTTGEGIRSGVISTWLLRPVPVIYEAIASDVAVKLVCFPFIVLITVVLGFLLGAAVPLVWPGVLLFLLSLVLAQVLRFMFFYVLALFAFWTHRIDALLTLGNTFVFLFAGQVAPVAILPGFLKEMAVWMPFRYMLGFPLEVLTGKLSPGELGTGLIIQAAWVVVVLGLYKLVWKKGTKSYMAVGG